MSRRMYKSTVLVLAFSLSLLFVTSTNAAKLSDHLAFLQPLIGKAWLGHYDNPEDAHFDHHIVWDPILEGQAVRATKEVPELNFTMETTYYWDPKKEEVNFLSVTNRGQLSSGIVYGTEGRIILLGTNIEASGNREFKLSFEVLADGTLEDRFFLKINEKWKQRHLIQYSAAEEAK